MGTKMAACGTQNTLVQVPAAPGTFLGPFGPSHYVLESFQNFRQNQKGTPFEIDFSMLISIRINTVGITRWHFS